MRIHRLSYLCCLSLTAIFVARLWPVSRPRHLARPKVSRISWRWALTSLAIAILIAPASAQQKAPERWALLIGVDDYAEGESLQYCGADQQGLAEMLQAAGWARDHVVVMDSQTKETKYQPTRQNIETQLDRFLQLVDEDDVLVFGFSGHGVHLDGKSYLCPSDARLDDGETMVPLEHVYKRLSESAAAFKLALVDACRDDPRPGRRRALARGPAAREFAKSLDKPPRGIAMLVSCGPLQQSIEDDQLRHGVFMNFVIDGLDGKADVDGDKQITLAELSRYAAQQTKLHVYHRYNNVQVPELKGELPIATFDFPVATLGKASVATSTPQPMPTSTPVIPRGGPKPGTPEAVITNSIGMKLTYIPAGEFEMGTAESPEELLRRFPWLTRDQVDDELMHKVRITKPFHLGIYEVTLGQFLVFYHDAGYRCEAESNGAGGRGINPGDFTKTKKSFSNTSPEFVPWSWGHVGQTDDHPVVNVSWNDARAFCNWLSKKEGKTYRLPTEAEWEYTCRAGTTTRFWCGNDPEEVTLIDNVGDATARRDAVDRHYSKDIEKSEFTNSSDGYVFTAPVGRFKPNSWGLFDLHGNATEWCQDRYGKNYYHDSPEVDPPGPATGTERVLRGGDWFYGPSYGRSGNRWHASPSECDYVYGFRVVREL